MKKITLLIFSCILATMFASCVKDDGPLSRITSDDNKLAGEKIRVGENKNNPYYKLFVLNEGNFGGNNSSLDFLRFTNKTYVRDAFSQMNRDLALGLGDTGNDLQVYANSLWAVMNGSGLVEVMSAVDEKHIATIPVPQPRFITFHDGFAYVTSYANINKDSEEDLGSIFKIDLRTLKKVDSLSLGYQPEQLTVCKDQIFVVNGGGNHRWNHNSYDKRITVISVVTFEIKKEIESMENLKWITNDGQNVWVANMYDTAAGTFGSGFRCYNADSYREVDLPEDIKNLHVSYMVAYPSLGAIYVIGAEQEIYPSSGYYSAAISMKEKKETKYPFEGTPAAGIQTPYGMEVNVYTGELYIADAGDWVNPGKVACFSFDLKEKRWEANAGILPAHFALYYPL